MVDRALRHSIRDGMAYSVASRRRGNLLLRIRAVPARHRAAGCAAHDVAAAARLVGAALLRLARPLYRAQAHRARWLQRPGGAVARDCARAGVVLRACRRRAARAALAVSQREQFRGAAMDEHHARSGLGAAARTLFRPSYAPHDDHDVRRARHLRAHAARARHGRSHLRGLRRHLPDRVRRAQCVRLPLGVPARAAGGTVLDARHAHRALVAQLARNGRAPLFRLFRAHELRSGHLVAVLHGLHAARLGTELPGVHGSHRHERVRAVLEPAHVGTRRGRVRQSADPDGHERLAAARAGDLAPGRQLLAAWSRSRPSRVFRWSGFTLSAGNLLYELVPTTRRAAYVAFHNVGTATGVFVGAMVGAALATVLPPRAVYFGSSGVTSNLLYLFALSGGMQSHLRGAARTARARLS